MRLRARILTLTLLGSSVPGQGSDPPEKDTHGGGPSPLHTVNNKSLLEATATFCIFFQFGAYFPPTTRTTSKGSKERCAWLPPPPLFLPPPSPQPLSIPPKELNSPRGDAIRHPPSASLTTGQEPIRPLPTTTAHYHRRNNHRNHGGPRGWRWIRRPRRNGKRRRRRQRRQQ